MFDESGGLVNKTFEEEQMKKRHGCLLTYILYIFIYIAYFIIVGKALYSRFTDFESGDLLVISLLVSFLLAIPTSLLLANWKSIIANLKTIINKLVSK
jgi:hypothetical protein